jgi:hypothetical protein
MRVRSEGPCEAQILRRFAIRYRLFAIFAFFVAISVCLFRLTFLPYAETPIRLVSASRLRRLASWCEIISGSGFPAFPSLHSLRDRTMIATAPTTRQAPMIVVIPIGSAPRSQPRKTATAGLTNA